MTKKEATDRIAAHGWAVLTRLAPDVGLGDLELDSAARAIASLVGGDWPAVIAGNIQHRTELRKADRARARCDQGFHDAHLVPYYRG